MRNKEFALIVAGGSGVRMKNDLPKQFMYLRGKPLLMHTLEAFIKYSPVMDIVLVLPGRSLEIWRELCSLHHFQIPHEIQTGGDSRFQSVKRGLELLPDKGYVAIHDGVRPLVSMATIEASFALARNHGAAIATVPLKESIRQVNGLESKSVDRSNFQLVQTPQTFELSLIKKAYEATDDETLTDDASVAEQLGYKVALFQGNYTNIKITTPEDLLIAEFLLIEK